MPDLFSTRWITRTTPLAPQALAVWGESATLLAHRLLEGSDETLARLRGVSWSYGFVLEGEAQALPWVDGVLYLGRDTLAPRLLLPTNQQPDVPLDLFQSAFERALAREMASPIAVIPALHMAISLGEARSLQRAKLEDWLHTSQGQTTSSA